MVEQLPLPVRRQVLVWLLVGFTLHLSMLLFIRLHHGNVHVNNSVPDLWTSSRPSQDGLVEMDVKMDLLLRWEF